MEITLLGTESLGVRGLCCLVTTGNRRILFDPGVALGYLRHGQLPHPCQVALGDAVRKRILSECSKATDVVISHYHGDHVPLADANPYQIPLGQVSFSDGVRFWCKGPEGCSHRALQRRQDLIDYTGRDLPVAEGIDDGVIRCLEPVPHGPPGSRLGMVMMTRVQNAAGGDCDFNSDSGFDSFSDAFTSFVHASDIQLLNKEAVDVIRNLKPTVVLASGPPLYLGRISEKERDFAWNNALSLAGISSVKTLILDHHLLRSHEGFRWLEALSDETGGRVVSAATFMKIDALSLEADRAELYRRFPVPEGWHAAYGKGEVGFLEFVEECGLVKEIKNFRNVSGIVV